MVLILKKYICFFSAFGLYLSLDCQRGDGAAENGRYYFVEELIRYGAGSGKKRWNPA
jgi:hypothetical protein